jgi:hypothetical protein
MVRLLLLFTALKPPGARRGGRGGGPRLLRGGAARQSNRRFARMLEGGMSLAEARRRIMGNVRPRATARRP